MGPYPCRSRFEQAKQGKPLAARSSVSSGDIFRAVRSGMAEAFARLRGLSIIGFSIYLAFEAAEAYVGPDDTLLSNVLDGIRDVLLVPFDIAIYRLLILGEVTSRYSFALDTSSRFQRIAGWTIGLWAFITLPLHALSLPTPSDPAQAIAVVIACIAAIAAGIAVTVRIALLFPAIASDARGATIGSALADTSGRFWLILKALVIAFLPLAMAAIGMVGLASLGVISDVSDFSSWSALPHIALIATAGFLTHTAGTVVASLLFDWIGDRVKGAPSSAAG